MWFPWRLSVTRVQFMEMSSRMASYLCCRSIEQYCRLKTCRWVFFLIDFVSWRNPSRPMSALWLTFSSFIYLFSSNNLLRCSQPSSVILLWLRSRTSTVKSISIIWVTICSMLSSVSPQFFISSNVLLLAHRKYLIAASMFWAISIPLKSNSFVFRSLYWF